jgi:hypothetical protein
MKHMIYFYFYFIFWGGGDIWTLEKRKMNGERWATKFRPLQLSFHGCNHLKLHEQT